MTMPVKDAPFLEERTAAVMESVFNDPIVKKALGARPFLRKFLRSRNRSKFVKFLLLQ